MLRVLGRAGVKHALAGDLGLSLRSISSGSMRLDLAMVRLAVALWDQVEARSLRLGAGSVAGERGRPGGRRLPSDYFPGSLAGMTWKSRWLPVGVALSFTGLACFRTSLDEQRVSGSGGGTGGAGESGGGGVGGVANTGGNLGGTGGAGGDGGLGGGINGGTAGSTGGATSPGTGGTGMGGHTNPACTWGFSPPATYTAGESPVAIAIADFDNDGNPDLAVGNYAGYPPGPTLNLLHNNGDGTFSAWTSYPSDISFNLAVGPFASQQSKDIVAGCDLFPSAGDGTFASPLTYSQTYYCGIQIPTNNLVAADFDGDGRLDFAWANYDVVAVYLNRGAGQFFEVDTSTYVESLATGDLDGDGRPDLVAVSWGYGNPSYLKILLNTGDGTFSQQYIDEGYDNLSDVAVGDLNGDGAPDIVVSHLAYPGALEVRLNQGGANFSASTTYPGNLFEVRSTAIGDLNGDGANDLVFANYGEQSLAVFFNQGDGTFGQQVAWSLATDPWSVALGDLNSDGHPDVAVAGSSSSGGDSVTVFLSECK